MGELIRETQNPTSTTSGREIEVRLVDALGQAHDLLGREGQSLMELALSRGLVGIDAECGGACSCATCHVYLDPAWLEALDPPGDLESEMLDFARAERRATSRLSCQIRLRPELGGLKATIAGE